MKFKQTLIKFTTDIKERLNGLIKIISTYIAELLVIGGAYFFIFATFLINSIAGYYCLGAILLLIGLFLAKNKQ